MDLHMHRDVVLTANVLRFLRWTQFQQHVTNEHSLHHPDLASSDQYHHSASEHRFQERSSNLSTASSVRSQKPTKSAPTPPSSEDEVEV